MAFIRTLQAPAYLAASAVGRVGRLARTGMAYAGGAFAWLRYLRSRGLVVLKSILVQAMVPAALGCFAMALDQHGFSHLVRRFSDAFGAGPSFKLFNGALWPLDYLYRLPWTGPALTWFGAGCALLVTVNVVHLQLQTIENPSLRVSMALWGINLALLALDVARCLLLPASWDAIPALDGLPAGHALRFAQVVVTLYLWSFCLVTARSRTDIERVRGWSWISMEVMGKLRLQAVILFLLGNLLLNFLDGALDLLRKGHDTTLIYAAMGMAVFLFFSPAFIALSDAISYAIALLSDGRLIIPTMPSPKRPERW